MGHGLSDDEVADRTGQVRRICLELPEVTERLSHGAATFFVRGKKSFVMVVDDHHGDGRLALWIAAPPGAQDELVDLEPLRFFVPPYVGHRGWLGVRIDIDLDVAELEGMVEEAYRCVAPKTLVRLLGDHDRPDGPSGNGPSGNGPSGDAA